MAEKILVPSIEKRIAALREVSRRNLTGYSITAPGKAKRAITISREFGCEGFPVAEKLHALLEAKTGEPWALMDKALLEEAARHHNLSEEIFSHLGDKNRFLDDMISTFSPRWHSDKDHYRLLCRQIVALASGGNVIIVGRGAAILTQEMSHCYHFRLVAPLEFRARTIARRLGIPLDEASDLVEKKEKRRDAFIRDFLNRDVADPTLYHLILNNGKNSAERIATTIFDYLTAG
jgi:cytidylate kinase